MAHLETCSISYTSAGLKPRLTFQLEEYDPLVPDAERLLKEHGPRVLATAMAVLDSRHAGLDRAARQAPSLLTGRKGYVCLLAYDPEHTAAPSPGDCGRIFSSLLGAKRSETAVGDVRRTAEGWAVDVEQRRALALMEDLRSGRQSAPFEVSVARRLPRLARVFSERSRRTPWASMRRRAFKRRQREEQPLADV